jgi:NAD(P)-dependent dehydrogenase (short-subunit alcohol dehydrogenase family)
MTEATATSTSFFHALHRSILVSHFDCKKMSGEKVYVVTGASSGIGVGIAESLAKSGVKKLVLVARRQELLEKVAESCTDLGAKDVLVLAKDLSDLKTAPEVVQETLAKFGRRGTITVYLDPIKRNIIKLSSNLQNLNF